MLAAGLLALSRGKERCEARQPFLAAANEVVGSQGVGEFLQAFGGGTLQECVGALHKLDALLAHPICQPVMLIEADSRRERKVGAHANKQTAPLRVVDIDLY